MMNAFKSLAEDIKDNFRGQRIYYLAGHGNLGDALIREATIAFLKREGIEFREIHRKRKGQIFASMIRRGGLIFGGGGGWHATFDHSYCDLKKLWPFYTKTLVLPSTYSRPFTLPKTSFYRRDQYESKAHMPPSKFCHDMAFSMPLQSHGQGAGTGHFFRRDVESTGGRIVPGMNRDISNEGNHYSDIAPFIEAIDACSEIRTDRLHVAITACLLGKILHFYPNNYFKNKAVYLTSMKGRFPEVTFHG